MKRIQISRQHKWKTENIIRVDRLSEWGNPFPWKGVGRAKAVEQFRALVIHDQEYINKARKELTGHDLACWCPLDGPCHADVLIEICRDK